MAGHGGTDFAPLRSFVFDHSYSKWDMGEHTVINVYKPFIWQNGDRLRLVVDMDLRTLTIHRNGKAVPGLVFEGLPDEVHIAATLKTKGSRVRIQSTFVTFVNEILLLPAKIVTFALGCILLLVGLVKLLMKLPVLLFWLVVIATPALACKPCCVLCSRIDRSFPVWREQRGWR